jgi:hypothetical protein
MGIFARRQGRRDVCGLGLCGYCGASTASASEIRSLMPMRGDGNGDQHDRRDGGEDVVGGPVCHGAGLGPRRDEVRGAAPPKLFLSWSATTAGRSMTLLWHGMPCEGIDIALRELPNTRWRGWWTTTFDRTALTPQTTGGRRPNRLRNVPPMIGRTQERI